MAAQQTDNALIGDIARFYNSVGDLIAQCNVLHVIYPRVFSNTELDINNEILKKLEAIVQPVFNELENMEAFFSPRQYIAAKLNSLPGPDTDISVLNEETLTSIISDVPVADATDSLDIAADVNALASVITNRAVTPPLAIGLFGNWGSGKSFFMKKLRKQIDFFAADEGDEYIERVVHIEFNSWHYSDSNLWASFVTKIFEELDSYGNNHADAVNNLFKELNSTSEFLREAETKLESIKATISKLDTERATKENEIADKAQKLTGIKLTDLVTRVWNNTEVQEKLADVKKQLPQKELNNFSDIYRSVKELDGFFNKFIETSKLLVSFKSWKSWVALFLFVAICTSPYWLFSFFGVHITDFFNWFGIYSAPVAIIFTNLAGIASYATIGLNKVQEKLKSIAGTSLELEKEAAAQYQSQLDKIQGELDVQKQAQIQKEAEINKLKKEQAEIEATIDDIKSGKKLASFIMSRVTDQRYINSLGLISWIRKDFQKLDELLKEQRELKQLLGKSKEEKEKIFHIDRIVLYIDDLDRCTEKVVVKVLEAIHLLLSFELFVVVVGVDPRWMHNALEIKYRKQLKKLNSKKQGVSPTEIKSLMGAATSYDYLEKIFQVPFSLKEIDSKGKWQLIDDNFKPKVQKAGPLKVESPNVDAPKVESPKVELPKVELPKQENLTPQIDNPNTRPVKVITPLPKTTIEIQAADNAEKITPNDQAPTGAKETRQTGSESKIKDSPEETEQNNKEIKRLKGQLDIKPNEIKFMKEISPLIGSSPRTVNRYLNIYRIIRSHRDLTKTIPIQDYCAVMILLGIITGLPDQSEDFFKSFMQEKSGTFERFIDKKSDEFQPVKDACKVTFEIPGSSETTVGKLSIKFMKQKLELVKRFSFRSYGENENVTIPSKNGNGSAAK